MYSLNVPLPGVARRRVESVRPALAGFETVREEPTLLAKRFGAVAPDELARVESEVRLALADASPFEVWLDGVGTFEDPPSGAAPVAYLAVESPGLHRLHARLVETFGAVEGLEGDDYVPHVTLARGGGALEPLSELDVDSTRWTASEVWFWDARGGERLARVGLSE